MTTVIDDSVSDFIAVETGVENEKIVSIYSKITQYLTWPILFPLFSLFYRINIHGEENLNKIASPFIIIANHISFYDSFLFRLIIGRHISLLPLRFMAVKRFDWKFLNFLERIGIIDLLYFLFGVLVVVKGRGLKRNLEESIKIIKAGGNVVIYPEGKIVSDGNIGEFKIGAAILAQKTGVAVLPVSFGLGKRFFIRRGLDINIGAPVTISEIQNPVDITVQFRKIIENLHSFK
jgi:1-acyl-sn-glycerol-3-phosphate acyltransferase